MVWNKYQLFNFFSKILIGRIFFLTQRALNHIKFCENFFLCVYNFQEIKENNKYVKTSISKIICLGQRQNMQYNNFEINKCNFYIVIDTYRM